jgi:type I restriction enzyme S subunit
MNLRFGAIGRHSGSEAVAVSKYYNIFFCDRTADARFCEFYFRSDAMITFYDNMAIGSLIEKRRVHFSDFLKFDIPFPLLAEQQKIAACLSSVDELMAAQGRKVDALKTHKKGLMQQLFPREGETQPRLRFPEFQTAVEWAERRLDELVDIQSGATPSKANPAFWNGCIPWVSAKT